MTVQELKLKMEEAKANWAGRGGHIQKTSPDGPIGLSALTPIIQTLETMQQQIDAQANRIAELEKKRNVINGGSA